MQTNCQRPNPIAIRLTQAEAVPAAEPRIWKVQREVLRWFKSR